MYNESKTIKLFDKNNNFVENFDDEVEKVLISIHGENYYDIDEDPKDYHLIEQVLNQELENNLCYVSEEDNVPKKTVKKKKIKILPIIFFITIISIIAVAAICFLNGIKISELFNL